METFGKIVGLALVGVVTYRAYNNARPHPNVPPKPLLDGHDTPTPEHEAHVERRSNGHKHVDEHVQAHMPGMATQHGVGSAREALAKVQASINKAVRKASTRKAPAKVKRTYVQERLPHIHSSFTNTGNDEVTVANVFPMSQDGASAVLAARQARNELVKGSSPHRF